MKTKRVNRYYCDYCKKSNCSAPSISKHERHCTMNPNRKCRMCERVDHLPVPMPDLLAVLPDPESMDNPQYNETRLDGLSFCETRQGYLQIVEAALPKLRELTSNCPACILAALRQRGICVGAIEGFRYKQECEAFWGYVNELELESEFP